MDHLGDTALKGVLYHQSSPNFPGGAHGKIPPATVGDSGDNEFDPQVRKIPWSMKQQPTLVFLPGKFHELRSLVSYSPWGFKKLDMNEHASLPKFSGKNSFWLVFLEYWQVRGENEKFGTTIQSIWVYFLILKLRNAIYA